MLGALAILVGCAHGSIETPSASGQATGSSAAPRSVRWARALALADVSAIGAEMARPFEAAIEVANRSRTKGIARDCNSALDWLAKGYEAPRDVDQRVLRAASIRCLALRQLASAAPARRSDLAEFRLSPEALGVLPAGLAFAVSDEAVRRVREAESRGERWRDLAPNATAMLEPADGDRPDPSLLVKGDHWEVRVTEYGRADFDGDGREDLMVRVDDRAVGGTFRNHRLFVLVWDPGRKVFGTLRELLP